MTAPTIGFGVVHEARLQHRFSREAINVRPIKAVWTRDRRGYGGLSITVLPTSAMANLNMRWEWDMELYREGERVHRGPLASIRYTDGKLALDGPTVLGWAKVRRLRTSRTFVQQDLHVVARTLLSDALGQEADPIDLIFDAGASGKLVDVSWDASNGVMASTILDELWSTHRLDGGMVDTTYRVPSSTMTLTDQSFIGSVPIDWSGWDYATDVFVRGLHESRSFPLERTASGPLVDYTVDRNTAKTRAAVDAAARSSWEERTRAGSTASVAGGPRLSPRCGLTPSDLAPGRPVRLTATDPFDRQVTSALIIDVAESTIGSDTNPARSPGGKFASDAQVATEYVELKLVAS